MFATYTFKKTANFKNVLVSCTFSVNHQKNRIIEFLTSFMEKHLISLESDTVFFFLEELPFYFILQVRDIIRCKSEHYCYPKVVCICFSSVLRTESVDGTHVGRGILRKVWCYHGRSPLISCMLEQHLGWEQTPQCLASKIQVSRLNYLSGFP